MSCCKSKAGSGLPSIPRQLKDVAIAMADSLAHFAVTGKLAADRAVITNRIAACEACEQFTGTRCRECGCYVHAKAALAASVCPLGRW